MKKSKKNKKQRRAKQAVRTPSIKTILLSWWKEKHPILVFMLVFVGVLAVFYVLIHLPFFQIALQPKIFEANAVISNMVLNLLGQGTQTTHSIISSNSFAIDIKLGCDALEPIALFAAAVLAYPAAIYKKMIGIGMVIPVLLVLNIVRIVSLFLVGLYWNSFFDLMHIDIWMVLFIFFTISLFFYWVQWSNVSSNMLTNA